MDDNALCDRRQHLKNQRFPELRNQICSQHSVNAVPINGGLSVDKALTIQVNDVNEAPTAVVDTINVAEDATTPNLCSILLSNDTDPDAGDTKNIIAVNTTGTKGYSHL